MSFHFIFLQNLKLLQNQKNSIKLLLCTYKSQLLSVFLVLGEVLFSIIFRTEILECLGDLDFLAKLHCVRQACEVQSNFIIITSQFHLQKTDQIY